MIEDGSFRVKQYLSTTSRCTSNTDEVVALRRDSEKRILSTAAMNPNCCGTREKIEVVQLEFLC